MGEFVKKTVMGYKSSEYTSQECTHVILTKEEYAQMMAALEQARQEKRAAQASMENAWEQARQSIQEAHSKITQEVDGLKRVLAEEKAQREYQEGLNENLKRICKERANADRKLRPKTEHSGFVVVSSSEKEHRYKRGQRWKTVRVWETVLQTPFSIDFTEEQARREIQETLLDTRLITKLGIEAVFDGTYSQLQEDTEFSAMNTALSRRLRANFRQGYWEMVFLHTKPLGIVPAEMRAQ